MCVPMHAGPNARDLLPGEFDSPAVLMATMRRMGFDAKVSSAGARQSCCGVCT